MKELNLNDFPNDLTLCEVHGNSRGKHAALFCCLSASWQGCSTVIGCKGEASKEATPLNLLFWFPWQRLVPLQFTHICAWRRDGRAHRGQPMPSEVSLAQILFVLHLRVRAMAGYSGPRSCTWTEVVAHVSYNSSSLTQRRTTTSSCDITLLTCLLIGSYRFCIVPLLTLLTGKGRPLWRRKYDGEWPLSKDRLSFRFYFVRFFYVSDYFLIIIWLDNGLLPAELIAVVKMICTKRLWTFFSNHLNSF